MMFQDVDSLVSELRRWVVLLDAVVGNESVGDNEMSAQNELQYTTKHLSILARPTLLAKTGQ